jgi:hypothetical protein
VTGDPELDAMSAISRALSPLESDVQGRVMRWAAERFGIRQASSGGISAHPDAGADSVTPGDRGSEGTHEFKHFAELFSAAGPTTDADKALVAAYWAQVVLGHEGWQSRAVNADLKHSGHGIGNITRALQMSIEKKPQLIIQLKKSGTSQQAIKTYKLTTEGVTYVKGLINTGSH